MLDNLIRFFAAASAYAATQVNVFRLENWADVLLFWQELRAFEEWLAEETER